MKFGRSSGSDFQPKRLSKNYSPLPGTTKWSAGEGQGVRAAAKKLQSYSWTASKAASPPGLFYPLSAQDHRFHVGLPGAGLIPMLRPFRVRPPFSPLCSKDLRQRQRPRFVTNVRCQPNPSRRSNPSCQYVYLSCHERRTDSLRAFPAQPVLGPAFRDSPAFKSLFLR